MLTINTLGKFQVSDGKCVLSDENMKSPTLTKLLVFLIIHRNESVSIDDISDALWQENETDNPAGALKNLVYRLRNILKKYFGDQKYILTTNGSYSWNTAIDVVLDIEEFEKMYTMAKNSENIDDTIHYLNDASDLYQGDFMSKNINLHWVVTQSVYYHSMYLSIVKNLASMYEKNEQFEDMEELCNEALNVDRVDEQLYYYLIEARARQGKLQLATETYERGCQVLYSELGIRHPLQLEKIYQKLLDTGRSLEMADIIDVTDELVEEDAVKAFFCGYPVFKEIYRLEARKLSREGESKYILLFTLLMKDNNATKENDKASNFIIKNSMPYLEKTLGQMLRVGDVVSQYSDNQFVVLLTTCTYENANLVANRILSRFNDVAPSHNKLSITVNLDEVNETNKL